LIRRWIDSQSDDSAGARFHHVSASSGEATFMFRTAMRKWRGKRVVPPLPVWRTYLDIARESRRDHYALIEFVKDDAVENFARDAATLRSILNAQPAE
jgi:hypothetical protein